MSSVTIALIIAGMAIIGLVIFFEMKKKEARQAEQKWGDNSSPKGNRDTVVLGTLDVALDESDVQSVPEPLEDLGAKEVDFAVDNADFTTGQHELDLFETLEEPEEIEPEVKKQPILKKEKTSVHETVVALTVMVSGDEVFEGADLLREFTAQNLVLGKDGYYHRPIPGLPNQYLFSVANVMTPGTLYTKEIIDLATKGLLLFMPLPTTLTPVQAFEQFYDAADGLAVTLGGKICDQQRNPLGNYHLEQMRDDMRHLEMKFDLEAKQNKQ